VIVSIGSGDETTALPASRWSPSTPVKGEMPILDMVIAYHEANNSPTLKMLLSSVGKLVETAS
jgi:hypothetical protein